MTGNNYGTANHPCDDYDELLSNLNSGSIAVEVSIFYSGCFGFVNEFDDSSPGSTKDISTNIALHFVFEVCRIKVFQSILDILDDR